MSRRDLVAIKKMDIGTLIGIAGILLTVLFGIVSLWSRIRKITTILLDALRRKGLSIESIKVHASPRKNVYALKTGKTDFSSRLSLNINVFEDEISLGAYDTENSPIYLLTFFPTKVLLPLPVQKGRSWEEVGVSNTGFQLRSTSKISSIKDPVIVPAGKFDCVKVISLFGIPEIYSGPALRKRTVWWAHGIGPVKINAEFRDGKCIGELLEYYVVEEDGFWPMSLLNEWTYIWYLDKPNTNRNVSEPSKEILTKILNSLGESHQSE